MNRNIIVIIILLGVCLGGIASARTWTDTQGRTVEADIVRVEGDVVVLKAKGKERNVPLAKLSQPDQMYILQWSMAHPSQTLAANHGKVDEATSSKSKALQLCGKPLAAGGSINIVEAPLDKKTIKTFSGDYGIPEKLKIGIALPAAFDPSKPQKVLWISRAINNDQERKDGNISTLQDFAPTAIAAGWTVIAADTDLGNPRGEDDQLNNGSDMAVQTAAVDALAMEWPKFKSWDFACAGHSGGGKGSFFRAGELLESDLHVAGLFLSGCNEDLTEGARNETGCSKRGLQGIRVMISNGKADEISTVQHAENVKASIEGSHCYDEVRLSLHDGWHWIDQNALRDALAWFATPDK